MSKFLKLEIKQKNCTGLYLKVEDNFQKELKNITDINKYLKDNQTVTLQLRQKVENKRGKKNFTFFYNETKEDFSKIDEQDYIRFKQEKYQYEVLTDNKENIIKKYDITTIDKPSIEDIMLLYVKGEK